MTIEELIAEVNKLEAEVNANGAAVTAKQADAATIAQEIGNLKTVFIESKDKLAKAKSDLAIALGYQPVPAPVNPVPVPIPSPIPIPQPNPKKDNSLFYIIIVVIGVFLAINSGLIHINNPFNPNPPAPTPTPVVVTDPIRVSYIFDKSSPTPPVREIRNNVEKIESELNAIDAQYRAYDISEKEVKDNYMDAVQEAGNQLPILVIQNDKTGKQIGPIIKSPATADDVINAAKNARNGKS